MFTEIWDDKKHAVISTIYRAMSQNKSTNPCILLSLGKCKPGMSSTNPSFYLCQERLQIAQEVSLIALLHEPRAFLVSGHNSIKIMKLTELSTHRMMIETTTATYVVLRFSSWIFSQGPGKEFITLLTSIITEAWVWDCYINKELHKYKSSCLTQVRAGVSEELSRTEATKIVSTNLNEEKRAGKYFKLNSY